jgi:hypothetical protein
MSNFKVFTNFVGIIKKIQTVSTGDGDYRITIDVPRSCKNAIIQLLGIEGQNEIIGFSVSKEEQESQESE